MLDLSIFMRGGRVENENAITAFDNLLLKEIFQGR